MSQWQLINTARFRPFFWTQFLGAFNDNIFKNALVILVTYRSMSLAGLAATQIVPLCAGLFILPFFLFSGTAGQLADKYPKTTLIRWVKLAEVGVMLAATVGLMLGHLPLLLAVLFLMGLQSTFFGPAKYSILPELVTERELVGGNALVETGTFVAILLGTILGGLLIAMEGVGEVALCLTVVAVALAGWLTSRRIPNTAAGHPDLTVTANPLTPLLSTYRLTRRNRPVFLSVLGISWFWFFGASLLTLLPGYTKEVLLGDELVVTLLLALFCIGVSIGSLLCERLSKGQLELGLVPLGSIGMTLFAADLFLVGIPALDPATGDGLRGPLAFWSSPSSWRVGVDFAGLAVFSGLYTVPLYTMIQQRSAKEQRARVIACNNILNALFMVASAGMLIGLTALGLTIPQIFLVLAGLNAAVALYIYSVIPEFLWRFIVWALGQVIYRIRIVGRENLPQSGPAVLICNHQSFVDWLFIAGAVRTPVRFVMHHTFMRLPLVRFFFRDAKVIPIAPAHENKETMLAAFDKIAEELEAGEIICIFPEGKLTPDGKLGPFRRGIERIIRKSPVPVIPMSLNGMWGSQFSRANKSLKRSPLKWMRSKVSLTIGRAVPPEKVTASGLAKQVSELGGRQLPVSP